MKRSQFGQQAKLSWFPGQQGNKAPHSLRRPSGPLPIVDGSGDVLSAECLNICLQLQDMADRGHAGGADVIDELFYAGFISSASLLCTSHPFRE